MVAFAGCNAGSDGAEQGESGGERASTQFGNGRRLPSTTSKRAGRSGSASERVSTPSIPSHSTSAPAGNVHGLVYEGLITRTLRGRVPRLARTWERVEVQEVEDGAYEPYTVSAETDDEGNLVADDQTSSGTLTPARC